MSEKTPTWISDWNPEDKTYWETKGKAVPAAISLVDRRRAHRIFRVADLEQSSRPSYRRQAFITPQINCFKLVGRARPDRLADAISPTHSRSRLRRPQLDDLQRPRSSSSTIALAYFRRPAGDAVLADAWWRHTLVLARQLRLEHGDISFLSGRMRAGRSPDAAGGNIGVSSVQLLTPS